VHQIIFLSSHSKNIKHTREGLFSGPRNTKKNILGILMVVVFVVAVVKKTDLSL
jgi:hypothetical protein